jgi:hypothetical protein
MIFDVLKLIQINLENYIRSKSTTLTNEVVVLGNIALAEELGGAGDGPKAPVIMSLVNCQEEAALKNIANYHVNNGHAVYQNPPAHLNLFVLFSILDSQYENSLKLLSRVIEFCQANREISPASTPGAMENLEEVKSFKVFLDLYSLTFEQLNHLWGSLGGKQVPFVLYRVRLVTVDAQKQEAEGPVITEIHH